MAKRLTFSKMLIWKTIRTKSIYIARASSLEFKEATAKSGIII